MGGEPRFDSLLTFGHPEPGSPTSPMPADPLLCSQRLKVADCCEELAPDWHPQLFAQLSGLGLGFPLVLEGAPMEWFLGGGVVHGHNPVLVLAEINASHGGEGSFLPLRLGQLLGFGSRCNLLPLELLGLGFLVDLARTPTASLLSGWVPGLHSPLPFRSMAAGHCL